ncbi:MAG: hypothetical protein JW704_01530, partial [Anaerolineaceae bacterium]|nr:hypothetical protein [Anaerolineaceae bacterium]
IRQIDIFSPEGEYLYRAKIELEKGLRPVFSPLDNLIISGNFLYAACEKEDDTVVIVKYHIDLPGRGQESAAQRSVTRLGAGPKTHGFQ